MTKVERRKAWNRRYYEKTKHVHNPKRAETRRAHRVLVKAFVQAVKSKSCEDCGKSYRVRKWLRVISKVLRKWRFQMDTRGKYTGTEWIFHESYDLTEAQRRKAVLYALKQSQKMRAKDTHDSQSTKARKDD